MFTPPSAAERPVRQQDAFRAAETLDGALKNLRTVDDVQRAFRARLREAHPDAGGDAAVAPKEIAELRAARDTLLRWLEQAPKADCKECGGTGYVWQRSGAMVVKPCSRCG
jgi:2-oxo-4-hydroxy-4-carboxy--5-ureidoimidazoline (OHCU) decarboxylase